MATEEGDATPGIKPMPPLTQEDQEVVISCQKRILFAGVAGAGITSASAFWIGKRRQWRPITVGVAMIGGGLFGAVYGGSIFFGNCIEKLSKLDTPYGQNIRDVIRHRKYRAELIQGGNPEDAAEPTNSIPQPPHAQHQMPPPLPPTATTTTTATTTSATAATLKEEDPLQ
eukprot:TRINITY_DN4201_c0_g1_i3.p1 TRINITY_DN4201_c0_g1~~TRINITY_DN4201_c0_g1_i3.p1  ORF type:complete len:171 (-),score=40.95 TRINITY_DN4201_c0_g1_i3:36-548(-)